MNEVIYDGFSFVDNGLVITVLDYFTVASRDNQIEQRANRPGGVLVQSQLGTKPIYMEGYYNGSSPTDAQNMYDTLSQALNRQERPLLIPHAGGTRRFIATPAFVILKQPDGLNRITFSFEFVIPEGSSEDTALTTLLSTTVTNATATIPLTVLGSTTARPFITLSFDSVTGGTGKSVSIRNARDYVGLTFERDFTTNDVITIDSNEFQIYINNTLTEPNGRLPSWESGPGSLFYSDTFAGRSVSINGTYKKRSL